jgi:hypothetical protein
LGLGALAFGVHRQDDDKDEAMLLVETDDLIEDLYNRGNFTEFPIYVDFRCLILMKSMSVIVAMSRRPGVTLSLKDKNQAENSLTGVENICIQREDHS